jgi:protein HIRA/HIR1
VRRLTWCLAGSNETPPVENWRIFRRLIGHDNDVQDLGWSYDGTILVSVGLDSKVVVWSGHTFEKLKTLSNHQSHVKGIAFDPANKYFATASDDRTIKVFRFTSPGPNSTSHDQMNNFVLETTISAPFANSPLTTYFRRCSWAPDGQHIAAANAVNGPVSAIAILNRGQWDGDTTLIGHEGPVEVCAFSPRLYGAEPEPPAKPFADGPMTAHTTVIACAGADKCLSIWTTSNPRPVVVTQDLAGKPISDLAWSPDGMNLFATALDGTILAVMFELGELGYPKSLEDNERSLNKFGIGRKGAGVVETPEALLLEELSKAGEIKGVEGRMGALMGDHHSSQPTANGMAKANGVLPVTSLTNGTNANTLANGDETGQPKIDPNQAKLERLKSRVEITKDGKKRIKPLLVSGAGGAESSLPQSRLVNASSTVQSLDGPQSIIDLSKPFDGLPKGGLAALLLGNKRKLAHIEGEEDGHVDKKIALASQKGATPILVNSADGLLPAQSQPAVTGQQATPEFIRPAVLNPVLMVSQLRLAVPKVRTHIVQGIDISGNIADMSDASTLKARADLVFEARNPPAQSLTGRAQDREPCRITLSRRDQPLWQDFLPRTVLLVTGNKELWAAADEAGAIFIWTPAGRRLVNALVMEAQPVILASYGSWLLCITAVGMCYVWNVKTMSSPHPPISLAPVLDAAIHSLTSHPTAAPAVTNARLNSEGRIIISLSNGEGYAYSPQMYTWQRLSEVWWAVGSQYWNTTDSSVGNLQSSKAQNGAEKTVNVSAGIIPFLERNTTNETLLRGRAYFLQRLIKMLLSREGFESFESGVSIAHLENRVAAALMLGAKDEFRLYLLMYVKRLGAEGLRLKVEELLRTLIGGIVEEPGQDEDGAVMKKTSTPERTWQGDAESVCGWSREELLKDVVLLLGKLMSLSEMNSYVADFCQVNIVTCNGSSCLMRSFWAFWMKCPIVRRK